MSNELLLKDHAFQETDGYNVELRPLNAAGKLCQPGDEVTNPRLLINIPADKMFIEITQTTPPYVVVICRADQEINALGLLEKCKDMVKSFVMTLNPVKSELTRGVKDALAILESRRKS